MNGQGIVGVNPYAKVMAIKVQTVANMYQAISFATNNGAKIINMSL
jgi:hypothetical protein